MSGASPVRASRVSSPAWEKATTWAALPAMKQRLNICTMGREASPTSSA